LFQIQADVAPLSTSTHPSMCLRRIVTQVRWIIKGSKLIYFSLSHHRLATFFRSTHTLRVRLVSSNPLVPISTSRPIMGSESPASSNNLPYELSVPSDQVSLFPLSNAALLAAEAGAYHPFTLQDMLEHSTPDSGSSTALPGCATLAGEVNPSLENPWMAMKRQAMINVLNRPSSYARGLPDYMPGSSSRSVQNLKMKGKQLVRDCSPPPAVSYLHVLAVTVPGSNSPLSSGCFCYLECF
jgi:hypothetical protein